jgi:hypothetical protein
VGAKQVLALTCLTPISETKTRITQIFWSDHWMFNIAKPFLRMGVVAFLKQDGGMVNLQNEGLRYDPALIWIDDADKQAKWYQQLKREWIKSRAEGPGFANPVKAWKSWRHLTVEELKAATGVAAFKHSIVSSLLAQGAGEDDVDLLADLGRQLLDGPAVVGGAAVVRQPGVVDHLAEQRTSAS